MTGGNTVPARNSSWPVSRACWHAPGGRSLVVHLQNDGRPGTVDEPGQLGWALYLPPEPAELVIRKTRDDGFQGTDLGRVLIGHQVSRLAIAGLLSEMCVSATARTALERGFGVVLPHDAHATCDIAAAPGFGQAVPAAIVSRVAEWVLGDQAELVASTEEPHSLRQGSEPRGPAQL